MPDLLVLCLSVPAAGFVLSLCVIYCRLMVIPEEKRAVVYRLGRFHRVAGPGVIRFVRHVDKIHHCYSVCAESYENVFEELYFFEVPISCGILFRYRFDPSKSTIKRDKARLAKLVQLDEKERHDEITFIVRSQLNELLTKFQNERSDLADCGVKKRVEVLLPRGRLHQSIGPALAKCLSRELSKIGVIISQSPPVMVDHIKPARRFVARLYRK